MKGQQYIYINRWGKVYSLVTIFQKGKQPKTKYIENDIIINADYYGCVIN